MVVCLARLPWKVCQSRYLAHLHHNTFTGPHLVYTEEKWTLPRILNTIQQLIYDFCCTAKWDKYILTKLLLLWHHNYAFFPILWSDLFFNTTSFKLCKLNVPVVENFRWIVSWYFSITLLICCWFEYTFILALVWVWITLRSLSWKAEWTQHQTL